MPGVPAPNFGALISGAKPNPLETIFGALAQIPGTVLADQQARQQMEQQKQESALRKQQLALQVQDAQREHAKTGYDFLTKMVNANPDKYKNDPATMNLATQYAGQLGFSPPVTTDPTTGAQSLDLESFKPLFDVTNTRLREDLIAMDPEHRKAILEKFSKGSVPSDLWTVSQFVSPKEQATIANITSQIGHRATLDTAITQRSQVQQQLADAVTRKDGAMVTYYQLMGNAASARADADLQNAVSHRMTAQAYVRDVDLKFQKFEQNPTLASQQLLIRTSGDIQHQADALDGHITTLEHDIETATGANATEDRLKRMNDELATMKQQREKMNSMVQRAREVQAEQLGTRHDVQQQSGKTVQSVTSTPPKGAAGAAAQPKKITGPNGVTYYLQPNGKYTTVPPP
jgi:hypothetical protein